MGAQWFRVVPFALRSGDEFREVIALFGPATFGSFSFAKQAKELVTMSAGLTDRQKMIAEYFADGPHSELPPGHWDLFAQFVSARDHHSVDEDVKLFFALTNAIFDAGIVAWDAKRAFDSVRPATAIPYVFQGQQIQSWGGPGKGTVTMDGRMWTPYQLSTFPTPPFPEYISGHSSFSAAGATVLKLFTGSDRFGDSVTLAPGSSKIEPGLTPSHPITLRWETFTDAANQAGISRRYGGIHFKAGDLTGQGDRTNCWLRGVYQSRTSLERSQVKGRQLPCLRKLADKKSWLDLLIRTFNIGNHSSVGHNCLAARNEL